MAAAGTSSAPATAAGSSGGSTPSDTAQSPQGGMGGIEQQPCRGQPGFQAMGSSNEQQTTASFASLIRTHEQLTAHVAQATESLKLCKENMKSLEAAINNIQAQIEHL